jgi:hypothetical protein
MAVRCDRFLDDNVRVAIAYRKVHGANARSRYVRDDETGALELHELSPPTRDDVARDEGTR